MTQTTTSFRNILIEDAELQVKNRNEHRASDDERIRNNIESAQSG